jgi:NAD(P)-dependent dehydrogenase (short-subunit alcohol dehydrogenase family)
MKTHRIILITGGAKGIGKELARHFLQLNDRVFILDIDRSAGIETVQELQPSGDIYFLHGDVSLEQDVARAIEKVSRLGGGLHVLINNAAISVNRDLQELSLDEWNRVIGVNLTGPFLCSRHAGPHLRKNGGCIINICSTRAFMSEPGTEAYSASKGGLDALTHALAMSYGPEVRVNAISPGWIDTSGLTNRTDQGSEPLRPEDHRQHPCGRVGRADDIARLAEFLADDRNSFITGQNFVADGGMTRKMIYV